MSTEFYDFSLNQDYNNGLAISTNLTQNNPKNDAIEKQNKRQKLNTFKNNLGAELYENILANEDITTKDEMKEKLINIAYNYKNPDAAFRFFIEINEHEELLKLIDNKVNTFNNLRAYNEYSKFTTSFSFHRTVWQKSLLKKRNDILWDRHNKKIENRYLLSKIIEKQNKRQKIKTFGRTLCVGLYENILENEDVTTKDNMKKILFKLAYHHKNPDAAFWFFIGIEEHEELLKLIFDKVNTFNNLDALCEYHAFTKYFPEERNEKAIDLLQAQINLLNKSYEEEDIDEYYEDYEYVDYGSDYDEDYEDNDFEREDTSYTWGHEKEISLEEAKMSQERKIQKFQKNLSTKLYENILETEDAKTRKVVKKQLLKIAHNYEDADKAFIFFIKVYELQNLFKFIQARVLELNESSSLECNLNFIRKRNKNAAELLKIQLTKIYNKEERNQKEVEERRKKEVEERKERRRTTEENDRKEREKKLIMEIEEWEAKAEKVQNFARDGIAEMHEIRRRIFRIDEELEEDFGPWKFFHKFSYTNKYSCFHTEQDKLAREKFDLLYKMTDIYHNIFLENY